MSMQCLIYLSAPSAPPPPDTPSQLPPWPEACWVRVPIVGGPGGFAVSPPREKPLLLVGKQAWWYGEDIGGVLGHLKPKVSGVHMW